MDVRPVQQIDELEELLAKTIFPNYNAFRLDSKRLRDAAVKIVDLYEKKLDEAYDQGYKEAQS